MKPYRTSAVCALLLAAGAWTARAQQASQPGGDEATKVPAPVAAKAKPMLPPLAIPANAVETAPGTYNVTDATGKQWIYRRTPFGIVKFEDRAAAGEDTTKKVAENIQAVEEGEFIRFERPSPFGTYRWKQKKTELDPLEQAAWDRAREKHSTAREKE